MYFNKCKCVKIALITQVKSVVFTVLLLNFPVKPEEIAYFK